MLGLDESAYCQVEALRELAPNVQLADGDAAMQAARLIKFPEEIALIEEACAIAEGVLEMAVQAIRPGVRETDVVAAAMHELYRLGGELSHVATPFVASGEHMAPPNRIPSDKIIRNGDVVFIDIGAMWSGYFGDIGRTVICGKPSRRQQEVYTAVYEGLAAATETMRAGATNDDVAAVVREAAGKRGLRRELHQPLHRPRRGHRRERAAVHRRGPRGRGDGDAAGRDDLRRRAADLDSGCPRRRRRPARGHDPRHRRRRPAARPRALGRASARSTNDCALRRSDPRGRTAAARS